MARYRSKQQSMQKFFEAVSGITVGSGTTDVPLVIEIPEEVIIKRVIANVVQTGTNAPTPGIDDEAFVTTVIQSDDTSITSADAGNPNKLVRAKAGGAWQACTQDFTLTMRKLRNSSVGLSVANLSSNNSLYYVSLTIHYLEV